MANGSSLNIKLLRNGETRLVDVTPVKDAVENRYIVGIRPTLLENPSLAQ
jgi:regulator of sigma E protease